MAYGQRVLHIKKKLKMDKSTKNKLTIALIFVGLVLGLGYWMYATYIKDKPKIQILAPKTTIETQKIDSIMEKTKYRK